MLMNNNASKEPTQNLPASTRPPCFCATTVYKVMKSGSSVDAMLTHQ